MAQFRAKYSFFARVDGRPRLIPRGYLVADTDPLLAGREAVFEPVDLVESATRAPGEQRRTRRAGTKPEQGQAAADGSKPKRGRPRLPRDADGNVVRD